MLPAGTTVSGHRIVGLVGEGGTATVYEAMQISLDRVVALKVVAKRFGDEQSFRERFRRECYIQAKLDHPNIVPVHGAGESEYGLWLTMRLIRGPTLRELLMDGRLEPEKAIELLAPVAGAVDVAHGHGLVHRDITPQNILIDEREQPFLSDFGITKGRGDRSLTRTGQFVGTLDYVAPEQIRDEPSEAPTDTYALAAILFECLTGRVPFQKGSEAAVLYAHIEEEPPRASEIEPSLPEAIDPVLERGLAKQPGNRFPTASDLIVAAEEALEPARPEPEPPPATPVEIPAAAPPPAEDAVVPPSLAEPRRRRLSLRRALSLAVAALLLAGAALAAGVIAADDSAPESQRLGAGGLEIDLPTGWTAAQRKRSGIPGMPLIDPLVLAPEGGAGGESVTVGFSLATGKTLLPAALRQTPAGPAKGSPVSLGSLEALRYRGLSAPGSADRLAVFASPTDRGVATVACQPDEPGTEFSGLCQRLASTLELTRGEAFPLGPSPALAVVLRRQLSALGESRTELRRKLGEAGDAGKQAAAASGLARAFRHVARTLSGRSVTPQSAAGLNGLVKALRSTRDAYKDLATAARGEDAAGYTAAANRVGAREDAVDDRLLAMRRLGYRVGTSG
jgi:tRNA A-37 threonylcarbamoyl transferase component Bud32